MRLETKPLPAATRLVVTCKGCGRIIPRREQIDLLAVPECPNCECTGRKFERIPAGWVARLKAHFRLMRWKKAQKGMVKHA